MTFGWGGGGGVESWRLSVLATPKQVHPLSSAVYNTRTSIYVHFGLCPWFSLNFIRYQINLPIYVF